MSASRTLSPIEQELSEAFGNVYESYGFKRLQGLIVGMLLTRREPTSLDDMVALLGHSKGPISTSVRRLADVGVIRKVNGPVNRRHYYAAHPDLFFNNFKFNMETVRKNRALAEHFISRVGKDGALHPDYLRDNLEHMRTFYTLMESFYQNFADEWNNARQAAAQDV